MFEEHPCGRDPFRTSKSVLNPKAPGRRTTTPATTGEGTTRILEGSWLAVNVTPVTCCWSYLLLEFCTVVRSYHAHFLALTPEMGLHSATSA